MADNEFKDKHNNRLTTALCAWRFDKNIDSEKWVRLVTEIERRLNEKEEQNGPKTINY